MIENIFGKMRTDMRNTRWIYRDNKKNYNIKKYSRDMLSILESRGLTTEEEIENNCIECE